MLSTIALFSSSRRHGNTGQLIDRIAFALNIEIVDLACQRMSSYDYEHLNRNDDFEPLMKRVLEHDPEALKFAALVQEAVQMPFKPQT